MIYFFLFFVFFSFFYFCLYLSVFCGFFTHPCERRPTKSWGRHMSVTAGRTGLKRRQAVGAAEVKGKIAPARLHLPRQYESRSWSCDRAGRVVWCRIPVMAKA